MTRRRSLLGLLVIILIAGCGSSEKSASPSAALAVVSPSPVVEPSASPTAVPSPSASPSASPTARPSPTATPLPTPVPTPVPWKSHTSKRFHYKMKYPPDWVVTPGDAKTPDEYDGFGPPWVYVSRDTVSGVASINLTMTRDIAYYKSHFKAKVVSNKAIKLDGWPGRIITFKGSRNGRVLLMQHIILAKGRVGYFLDMDGDYENRTADKAMFKAIYKTWRST